MAGTFLRAVEGRCGGHPSRSDVTQICKVLSSRSGDSTTNQFAQDQHGIQSEALRVGGALLATLVRKLMVRIFSGQWVPDSMKGGKPRDDLEKEGTI